MKRAAIFLALCCCVAFLGACARGGLDSAKKTSQLRPQMTYDQVVALLGEPESTELRNGKLVALYWLHEMWKGNIPYDLTFDARSKRLISWKKNEEKLAEEQAYWASLASIIPGGNEGGAGGGGAAGPNDAGLMQQFAGYYYSFSSSGLGYTGGTERKLMLCPDGRYFDSAESGYSGSGWGSASQGSGGGRWSIQGDMNGGTITFTNKNGSEQVKFSRCGSDCVYFGSIKFAYAGPPQCN